MYVDFGRVTDKRKPSFLRDASFRVAGLRRLRPARRRLPGRVQQTHRALSLDERTRRHHRRHRTTALSTAAPAGQMPTKKSAPIAPYLGHGWASRHKNNALQGNSALEDHAGPYFRYRSPGRGGVPERRTPEVQERPQGWARGGVATPAEPPGNR